MTSWTPQQKQALEAEGCSLLVSAAAGSGKTAVLTERIAKRIIDPDCPLSADNMAVVTFTKAAAKEMRDRISKKLSEECGRNPKNSRLKNQLMMIGGARISTIHSFCYSIIRENADKAGVSSTVRIADDEQKRKMSLEAAKKVIRAYYGEEPDTVEHDTGDFLELCTLVNVRVGDENLIELMEKTYDHFGSYPGHLSLLEKEINKLSAALENAREEKSRLYSEDFFIRLCSSHKQELGYAKLKLLKAKELVMLLDPPAGSAEEIIQAELANVCRCIDAPCRSFKHELELCSFDTLRFPKGTDESQREIIKQLRNDAKELVQKLKKRFENEDENTLFQSLGKTLRMQKVLLALLKDYESELFSLKEKANLITFCDLEQLCAKLLYEDPSDPHSKTTKLAKRLSDQICELYVDEYQDTNLLQDMILRAVSKPGTMFMVGDPKQSVYGFRGAKPEIFASYKNSFEPYSDKNHGPNCKISLANNFRCDSSVIDITNLIFSVVMNTDKSNPLYAPEDMLIFTKNSDTRLCSELCIIDTDLADEEKSFYDPQGLYVAQRIKELMASDLVTEKGFSLDYGDIAVLCRGRDSLARIRKALTACGIPCSEDADESFFSSPEMLFTVSLLRLIDNPQNDVALAAVLNSPVFSFSPDMLLQIRTKTPEGAYFQAAKDYPEQDGVREKLDDFFALLDELRQFSRHNTLSELILKILDSTKAKNIYCVTRDPIGVKKNFMLLSDIAADCDGPGESEVFDLLEHLDYFREKRQSADDTPHCVKLMTHHGSKGLEFPVVFVADLQKEFNSTALRKCYLLDPKPSIAFKHFDENGFALLKNSYYHSSALGDKQSALEEEKRILYVAMTRARQKLFLVGTASADGIFKKCFPAGQADEEAASLAVGKSSSHLDLILAALSGKEEFFSAVDEYLSKDISQRLMDNLLLSFTPLHLIKDPELRASASKIEECQPPASYDPEKLERMLDFEYPFATLSAVPKKLSVSDLSPITDADAPQVSALDISDIFSDKKSGAFVGSAMHQFMQFCDYQACEKDPISEADRLCEKGFISPEQRSVLRFGPLKAFFDSELYRRLKESSEVKRELRFNTFLKANELIEGAPEEMVLVQGVVDCFFENPDGTLCLLDYKTDALYGNGAEKILCERHCRQLKIYKAAIEKMTQKTVKDCIIYSFSLSKAIKV